MKKYFKKEAYPNKGNVQLRILFLVIDIMSQRRLEEEMEKNYKTKIHNDAKKRLY